MERKGKKYHGTCRSLVIPTVDGPLMRLKICDYLGFPVDPRLPRGHICTIILPATNYFEFNGIGAPGLGKFGRAGQDFGTGKAGWHGRNR